MDPEMEELLRSQEEFFRASQAPAARVIRQGPPPSSSRSSNTTTTTMGRLERVKEEGEEEEASLPPPPPVVNSLIIERTCDGEAGPCAPLPAPICRPLDPDSFSTSAMARQGFPTPVHRSKASHFARRRQQQQQQASTSTSSSPGIGVREATGTTPTPSGLRSNSVDSGQPASVQPPSLSSSSSITPPPSQLLPSLANEEIHRENLDRLEAMTPAEIEAAQKEIMSMFSPEMIAALRSMGGGGGGGGKPPLSVPALGDDDSSSSGGEEEGKSESGKAVGPQVKTLLGRKVDTDEALEKAAEELLDEEEKKKLAWTRPIRHVQPDKEEVTSTSNAVDPRINLAGHVVDQSTEENIPTHTGLHHNPEQRAGYTLQQLADTARSSDKRQRAMGLRVWSLLLQNPATVKEVKRLGGTLPKELPWAIRLGLDDRNLATRREAVAALESFVVGCSAREESLDDLTWVCHVLSLRLCPTPSLTIDNVYIQFLVSQGHLGLTPQRPEHAVGDDQSKKSTEDNEEEKDEDDESYLDKPIESAEEAAAVCLSDPCLGMYRCGVVERIKYLLERDEDLQPDGHASILRTLTAIARRGKAVAERVGATKGLLTVLQNRYLEAPPSGEEGAGRCLLEALRLVRVLCQANRAMCLSSGAVGVFRSVKGHLALAEGSQEVKAEVLRLWRVALSYGADLESFFDVMAMLSSPSPTTIKGKVGLWQLSDGLFLTGTVTLACCLYRAMEAACRALGDWRKKIVGSTKSEEQQSVTIGGITLEPGLVGECWNRMEAMIRMVAQQLNDSPSASPGDEPWSAVQGAQWHLLATWVEAGGSMKREDFCLEELILMNLCGREPTSAHWIDHVLASAGVLSSGDDQSSLVVEVDVLYGLVRLAGAILPTIKVAYTKALIVAFLNKVVASLSRAQINHHPFMASIEGPSRSGLTSQAARRLLLRLMVAAASPLVHQPQQAPRDGVSIRDCAMKMVPLSSLGDELQVSQLIDIAMHPLLARLYRQVTCGKTQLAHAQVLFTGSTLDCTSLLLVPSMNADTMLPLPQHWVLLPLISQGADDVTTGIIRACLTMIESLEQEAEQGLLHAPYITLLSPSSKLWHVMNVGTFRGPVLSDPEVRRLVRCLSSRYLNQAGISLHDDTVQKERMETLVNDLLERVQEDVEGLDTVGYLLRLFILPNVMPPSLRQLVWRELGTVGLLHLLDVTGPDSEEEEETIVRMLFQPESRPQPELLDLYIKAVTGTHSFFGLDRGGLIFAVAVVRLAQAIFTIGGVLSSSNRVRLSTILVKAPTHTVACLLSARGVVAALGPDAITRAKLLEALEEGAKAIEEGVASPEGSSVEKACLAEVLRQSPSLIEKRQDDLPSWLQEVLMSLA